MAKESRVPIVHIDNTSFHVPPWIRQGEFVDYLNGDITATINSPLSFLSSCRFAGIDMQTSPGDVLDLFDVDFRIPYGQSVNVLNDLFNIHYDPISRRHLYYMTHVAGCVVVTTRVHKIINPKQSLVVSVVNLNTDPSRVDFGSPKLNSAIRVGLAGGVRGFAATAEKKNNMYMRFRGYDDMGFPGQVSYHAFGIFSNPDFSVEEVKNQGSTTADALIGV